jgi:4,5-DOPA dioxygenase extradiol
MLPAIFLSHGSPTLPLVDCPARDFLKGFGASIERPKAILVASAHWETKEPTVNAVPVNDTIHDFYGFPRELYAMHYPAPGSTEIAKAVQEQLATAAIKSQTDTQRGLDHGAWVPLLLMYPEADIPVVQLSVQSHLGPEHHETVGKALRSLREQGVLIVGSGSFTHDLSEFRGRSLDEPAPDWVTGFADWFDTALREHREADLLAYRRQAPFAVKNHPTEEHLLPLFVALGAGSPGGGIEHLHSSVTHGVLRMDAYAFH